MLPRKMLPRSSPDGIHIAFDDHRLVNNAGLILPATLAQHLGLPQLVQERLDLGNAPGRANTGDKIVTLVASALAGGDCIDDADVLRTGRTASALGCVVKAPSTLGTFLPEYLPAQLPVGPRPPVGSGGPGVAGLGRRGRTRRRADVSAARGPRQHRSGRGPLPAGNGGSGAPCWSHRTTHGAGRQRLLCPRPGRGLPRNGCPLLHHRPPARPIAEYHRGYTRGRLDAHPLLDGGCCRRG